MVARTSFAWRESKGLPAPSALQRLDTAVQGAMSRHGMTLLRFNLGLVFLWFGFVKFFPGESCAEGLVGRTIAHLTGGLMGPRVSMPLLAVWECTIGVGLIHGRWMRPTLALLLTHMLGTFLPLFLFPHEMFLRFPLFASLEGQYILKNLVLASAGIALGGCAAPVTGQGPCQGGPPLRERDSTDRVFPVAPLRPSNAPTRIE